MPLDTVYLLGEVGIFCLLIYYFYIGIKDKKFSVIPIILGMLAWFLSSFVYYEIVRNIGTIQSTGGELSADLVGAATILLSMNSYVMVFIILLSIVYILVFIIYKVIEGAKAWKRK